MSKNQAFTELTQKEYQYGFSNDFAADEAPRGLSEDIVRLISSKKNEPAWLLEWRLKAYRQWLTMEEPTWPNVKYPRIDYQDIIYYSAPKSKGPAPASLNEVDPEMRAMFDKLGISLREQERLSGIAVDAVVDSVSVATTFKDKLGAMGVIFCSFSEAVREHPELVKKYLARSSRSATTTSRRSTRRSSRRLVLLRAEGRALPDGAVDLLPHQRRGHGPVRAHADHRRGRLLRQLPRGLHRADARQEPAPRRGGRADRARRAEIKYSTVQNWYPGDKNGVGGIYNFVTKRGACRGKESKISWTQVETGSAITWKYPSVLLMGDDSVGEFYSVAVVNNHQQADTGTKMITSARTRARRSSPRASRRGRARTRTAASSRSRRARSGARNYSQCDSLLIGDKCGAHTFPYIEARHPFSQVEHEATTSKISTTSCSTAASAASGRRTRSR
jgi:Fe-S cluster assembly protein SufB